jgi:flagellar hook-basal body complex protein FliE
METTPLIVGKLPLSLPKTNGAEVSKAGEAFSKMLSTTIAQVNQADINGDKAIEKLHTGEAKNLHEVMIAVEEADISIRMLVQMRNKALEVYNQIMQMQV